MNVKNLNKGCMKNVNICFQKKPLRKRDWIIYMMMVLGKELRIIQFRKSLVGFLAFIEFNSEFH